MQHSFGIVGQSNVTVTSFSTEEEDRKASRSAMAHGATGERITETVSNTAVNQFKRRIASQGATETRFYPV